MRKLIIFWTMVCMLISNVVMAAEAMSRAEFDKKRDEARMLALAITTCCGTYIPGGKAWEYSYLRESGWEIIPYKSTANKVDANFMMASNVNENLGILAFRGSHSKADWVQDLTFDQVNYGGHSLTEFAEIAAQKPGKADVPKVHRGFNNYVTAALNLKMDIDGDHVVDNIAEKLKAEPNTKLLITGHSLGGAAAMLYAERLVALGVNKEQIPVITFGAPNVGNETFAKEYGDKINLLRVETGKDPVPFALKLLGRKYHDFGQVMKLNVSSKYTDNFHDNGFYMDYIMRHYYEVRDEGVDLGYIQHRSLKKVTPGTPLVAIQYLTSPAQTNELYIPNIRRFILDEYRDILPSYVMLKGAITTEQWEMGGNRTALDKARAAGAQYLLGVTIGRRRLNQGTEWTVFMEQHMFEVATGNLMGAQTVGNKVELGHGVMQATMADFVNSREQLKHTWNFVQ